MDLKDTTRKEFFIANLRCRFSLFIQNDLFMLSSSTAH